MYPMSVRPCDRAVSVFVCVQASITVSQRIHTGLHSLTHLSTTSDLVIHDLGIMYVSSSLSYHQDAKVTTQVSVMGLGLEDSGFVNIAVYHNH